MARLAVAVLVVAAATSCAASAQDMKQVETLRAQGSSVVMITQVFSQLVMLSYPKGFKAAHEQAQGNGYILELVLDGETVEKWSEMITITGNKGLAAANPNAAPQAMVEQFARRFNAACPETLSLSSLGPVKISSFDGSVGVMGCGTVRGQSHSEMALILAIKGSDDFYTVQWAERTAALTYSPPIDQAKWTDRLKQLTPIKLCPVVPGEKAPFPSCSQQK